MALKRTKCPHLAAVRTTREGLLERFLLPRLNLYPWECHDCGRTFYRLGRGRSQYR